MKSDSQLRADILEELKWDPRVNDAEIGVAVKDAVVTLTGFVDSYAQQYAAERAAERVGGVRALAEDLKVKLPGSHERTDTDIAHAAAAALDWDIEVPDGIKTVVRNGWITLEGTVEWQYQKTAAERAVRYLNGVKGMSNLITVKPKRASTFEVGQQIRNALRRNAEIDAGHITVEASVVSPRSTSFAGLALARRGSSKSQSWIWVTRSPAKAAARVIFRASPRYDWLWRWIAVTPVAPKVSTAIASMFSRMVKPRARRRFRVVMGPPWT